MISRLVGDDGRDAPEAKAPFAEKKLTVADKLVLAANNLEKATGRGFTAEDLVVKAFEDFPDTFGLRGHVDDDGKHLYPDSNRVFAEIMGSKPLRSRGLLEKTGDKMYRLTSAGRTHAEDLLGVEDGSTRRSTMTRDDLAKVRRYLAAKAVLKYSEGRIETISFTDACAYWGISARSDLKALNARRSELLDYVERARAGLQGASSAAVDNAGRRTYTEKQIDHLLEVDQLLRERFAKELKIIGNRRTER